MSELKDLIAIFKAETEEHLTKLENGLVELERRPENPELVRNLNREVHTLKGAARVFGFLEIQEIAHRIEDILEAVAEEKVFFNSYRTEQLFKGFDAIRIILERIARGKEIDLDISDICKNLETCLSKGEATGRPRCEPGQRQKDGRVQGEALPCPGPEESFSLPNPGEEYIRIPLSRADKLLYLVGEVVIHRMKSSAKIAQAKRFSKLTREVQKTVLSLGEAIKKELAPQNGEVMKWFSQCHAQIQRLKEQASGLYDQVSSEVFHLDPVIDQLQTKMKGMKMLPLSTIFEGFPRMVRDIASQQGKEIRLVISGGETELDKRVLEGIRTSLIHLLRNSIDHGIETPGAREALGKPRDGILKISAVNEGGHVRVAVEDDGKGMDFGEIKQNALRKGLVSEGNLSRMTDREILNIVFLNGYSTSPMVTEVSGRGMGLDIVMRDITHLKGQVTMDTQKNRGTKFTLVLPLSIAIIQSLFVKVKDMRYALPMSSVKECLRLDQEEISTIEGRMAISFHEHIVPLVRLSERLGLVVPHGEEERAEKTRWVVVVTTFGRQIGLMVDEIIGEDEVFIKSLGKHLGKVRYVGGAAVMSDGDVVVVLDVEDLMAYSGFQPQPSREERFPPKGIRKQTRILLVEDVFSTRELERSILENHGYLVDTAVDGLDALNRITGQSYDLIVSDIEMPRMDGFELCKTLKNNEAYKDIPILMLTALQKEEDKRRGMEVGAAAYLIKNSFDQNNLLDTIERLIG